MSAVIEIYSLVASADDVSNNHFVKLTYRGEQSFNFIAFHEISFQKIFYRPRISNNIRIRQFQNFNEIIAPPPIVFRSKHRANRFEF